MPYPKKFNYKDKKILLEIGGKHEFTVQLERVINLEFYSNDRKYTILRIPFNIDELSCLTPFHINKNNFLLIKNISITDRKFKDEKFGWLTIKDLDLKIFINPQIVLTHIDVLIRNNSDGTISYIGASSDMISEDIMHKIVLNL